MLAIVLDAIQHTARPLRQLAINTIDEQFGVAEDRVQWCAKPVAHAGEESRFVLARGLELPVQITQLLRHSIDVGRQSTQFVAIFDFYPLGEIAGSDLVQT